MEFIALIIALAVERFVHVDSYISRFTWFKTYMDLMQSALGRTGLFNGTVALISLVLPIVIVVWIVYCLVASIAWGLIGFVLATIILIYCLGPKDLYTGFEAYFIAVVRDDKEARKQALDNLLCIPPEKEADEPRALTKSVFSHFYYALFTCIFWFLILGPLAPVLYRVIAEIHKQAHFKDSPFASILPSANMALNIIEWIPVRVAALGFALVGDFHHGFSYWFKHVISGLKESYNFCQEAGLAALGIIHEKDGSHDAAEVKSALLLIDRTLILFVVVTALFVLGAVIY